jgi:ubiquinone/menaquinone biosynthesis C-methylase UbiE
MTARYDAEWIADLLSAERMMMAQPTTLLSAAGVAPGSVVVDAGCGPGFFTIPAAHLVGARGHVYAVDVEPQMLEVIEERAEAEKLDHVTAVLATPGHIPLPDACASVVLCSLVLHDLDGPGRARMAGELARLCALGGAVLVIEWNPRAGDTRPNRMQVKDVEAVLSGAGLPIIETGPLGDLARPSGQTESMYRVLARKSSANPRI